jgi:hypothetical protein
MAAFLTVAAKLCRQAEHSLQQAAGNFNVVKTLGATNDERAVDYLLPGNLR